MHIEGHYLLTGDEYAGALKVTRAYRRWATLALAGAFGLTGVTLLASGNPQPGGFCLVLVPVYLAAPSLEIRWARRKFGRRTDRLPTMAVFTDTTFATRSAMQTVKVAWQACLKTVETPESFLIYASKRNVAVVPKRAFSPPDLAVLSDFLRGAIPAASPHMLGRP
jgi:hypothetical protein